MSRSQILDGYILSIGGVHLSRSSFLPILLSSIVLVHVVYSLSGSIASRNLTGWEWLGIAFLFEFSFPSWVTSFYLCHLGC